MPAQNIDHDLGSFLWACNQINLFQHPCRNLDAGFDPLVERVFFWGSCSCTGAASIFIFLHRRYPFCTPAFAGDFLLFNWGGWPNRTASFCGFMSGWPWQVISMSKPLRFPLMFLTGCPVRCCGPPWEPPCSHLLITLSHIILIMSSTFSNNL